MRFFGTAKIFVAALLAMSISAGAAAPALAQFDDGNRVPIILKDEGSAFDILTGALGSVGSGCSTVDNIAGILADTVGNITDKLGGLQLIGANPKLVAELQLKLTKVNAALSCYNRANDLVRKTNPSSLVNGQRKQTAQDEIQRRLATLEARKDQLTVQSRLAKTGFWKAILMMALLKTSKNLVERVINSMTTKFRINDYARYADSLAGQVYTVQRILDSSGDKSEQMLLQSMLYNPLVKKTVDGFHPGIVAKAQVAAGNFNSLDIRDPNWYFRAAQQGTCSANPFCVNLVQQDKAQGVALQGRADASSNISQSNGYKEPWTCSDNVAKQQQITQQYNALLDEFNNRNDLFINLNNAKDAKLEDIRKAEQDLQDVAGRLNTAPQAYDTSAYQACKAIVNPASFIAGGLQRLLDTQTKQLGDIKEQNMPFFINFFGDIITSFTNKLIFGDSSSARLIVERAGLNKAIGTTISGVQQEINAHLDKDSKSDVQSTGGSGTAPASGQGGAGAVAALENPGANGFDTRALGGAAGAPGSGAPGVGASGFGGAPNGSALESEPEPESFLKVLGARTVAGQIQPIQPRGPMGIQPR